MKPTSNDKLIAYLALFSGLSISAVAIYYSVMGLVAIYPAMVIPIVIMGVVLELGKLSATVWLKQSWAWAPIFLKAYILPAVAMLMFITSIGVFGFLSKAHSDQSLVSGDVGAKIAVYDEKIKTEKDNIDANRKSLKQMDEAVDQVMARSTSEGGADKAVAIRRSQQKERARLLADITESQKRVSALNEQRAPIAAEVRKVEAEVGPIKYIAALMYGDNPDANVLEKAVTWVTILIVIVLDPLAVVLLLASQYSFQRIREYKEPEELVKEETSDPISDWNKMIEEAERAAKADEQEFFTKAKTIAQEIDAGIYTAPTHEPDDGSLTDAQLDQLNAILKDAEEVKEPAYQVIDDADDEEPEVGYAYLNTTTSFWAKPEGWVSLPPMVHTPEAVVLEEEVQNGYQIFPELIKEIETHPTFDFDSLPPDQEYVVIDGQNMHVRAARGIYRQTPPATPAKEENGYVQNEEQQESGKWNRVISEAEYRDRVVKIYKNDSQDNPSNPT